MNDHKQRITGPALFTIVLLAAVAVISIGYAYFHSHIEKNAAGKQTTARSNAVASIRSSYAEGVRNGKTSFEIAENLYYFTCDLTGDEHTLSIAMRNKIECINMSVFSVLRVGERPDILDGALIAACKQVPITNGYFAYFYKSTNSMAEAPETASIRRE